ncbi:MAG: hypothetical protein II087_03640 [Muribaculaceae bacterium]|nr:hypothetical protein [Muribaculaceae bacterium]
MDNPLMVSDQGPAPAEGDTGVVKSVNISPKKGTRKVPAESGVIKLVRNEVKQLDCNERLFKTIVKTSFGQRRKTLRNSLRSLLPKDSPALEGDIFRQRPEQLSVSDFINLTNIVTAENNKSS